MEAIKNRGRKEAAVRKNYHSFLMLFQDSFFLGRRLGRKLRKMLRKK
jgi:hypothetical protein